MFLFFFVIPIKKETSRIVITTTTMLNDLVKHLIGDVDKEESIYSHYVRINNIKSYSLIEPAIDPHNYTNSFIRQKKIKEADLITISSTNGTIREQHFFQTNMIF
ncbi:MAG: hypothetical protein Q8899_01285 [Weeping tea tree witches'-broom phytoplasma]|uniref:hypothetical protein n=1 Tax=Candidatus Phytoplasma melaleucae TaxID=2982630 RepID=UPI00293B4863|nr:hypothetical protein [Weeping tea tree witches'-broom phytoplasma]